MIFVTRRACIAALAIAATLSPYMASADDCFAIGDSRQLTYDVFQIGAPPRYSPATRSHAERSPLYPASDYAAASSRQLRTTSGNATPPFRKHYLLWANRCIYLEGITPDTEACRNTTRTKGNGYPGMTGGPLAEQLRIAHSTYAKANACTLISAMSLLGVDAAAIADKARSTGLNVIAAGPDRTQLSASARSVVAGTGKQAAKVSYLVDTCVVETEPLAADVTGIVLDYEVFDSRTPSEALAFLRDLQGLLRRHGKTLIVNTNPLPREPNGLTADNMRDVIASVDGLAPTISSGGSLGNPDTSLAKQERKFSPLDSYRLQVDVLTDRGRVPLGPAARRKIIWNISLHDTTLAEAKQLRDEVIAQGYRGIMLFRNYVKQGGACSRQANQVTACLAFGACDGAFGKDR